MRRAGRVAIASTLPAWRDTPKRKLQPRISATRTHGSTRARVHASGPRPSRLRCRAAEQQEEGKGGRAATKVDAELDIDDENGLVGTPPEPQPIDWREVAQQAEGPLAISLVAMGADSKDPSAQQVVRALVEAATRDHRAREKLGQLVTMSALSARETWRTLLEKAEKTRGSDDLGWLRTKEDGLCTDVTPDFLRRLEATQAADKAIDTQYAYLFVAGLFNEFYPGYLRETVTHFSAAGAVAVLSGARGDALVRDNAVRILAEVETLASRTGKRVVLVGHSKGGLDCAAALALFEHRLAPHVRGLVTVQSPYGGSPIAADLLAEPTLAKAVEVILEKLVGAPAGDGKRLVVPIADLCYAQRQQFVAAHPLPARFPVVCFHSATAASTSLLYVPAEYIRRRYGASSDGLVAACDAEVPGAAVVRYEAELDHLDAVFPVEYSSSLTTPAPFHARQNTASPVVGRLIVRTSTVLKSVFKERAIGMPSSSHLHESLVSLMLAQSWPPAEERTSH